MTTFTLLDGDAVHELEAELDAQPSSFGPGPRVEARRSGLAAATSACRFATARLVRPHGVDLPSCACARPALPSTWTSAWRCWRVGRQPATSPRSRPRLRLGDLEGRTHRLSDLRGKKRLLVTWGSWCGCREDLPVWQALHEGSGEGLVPITVALDSGPEAARPFIERAAPTHPRVDRSAHQVADLFHMINVPTMVWIDEAGKIVRPNDQQFGNDMFVQMTGKPSGPFLAALRAWVNEGRGALAADEVRDQQLLPTPEHQLARAEFRLAWWLHQHGRADAAEPHFARAGALAPNDWTIRRAQLPIRGIDPMTSNEFIALWEEGVPQYPTRTFTDE